MFHLPSRHDQSILQQLEFCEDKVILLDTNETVRASKRDRLQRKANGTLGSLVFSDPFGSREHQRGMEEPGQDT